jgi:hypothetical protein
LTEDSDDGYEWLFLPFSIDYASKAKITDHFQDNLIGITTDCRFQIIFKEMSFAEACCEVTKKCPSLGGRAVTALLQFGSRYLCKKKRFSAMAVMKTITETACGWNQNFFSPLADILPPTVEKVTSSEQAQVPHLTQKRCENVLADILFLLILSNVLVMH